MLCQKQQLSFYETIYYGSTCRKHRSELAEIGFAMLKGHIEFTSIPGPLTNKPVRFGIYLPAEYETAGNVPFAVLYFLHGLNEDYRANLANLAQVLETGVDEGIIRPMLIITPDSYANGMWADSKSGHKPSETHLIRELIPHIDSTYRTIARRSHRIIGGFSMGGYGACRCAVKYSELFSTCFSMDGAMHTLGTMKRIRGPIYAEIFEDDDDYFRDFCLYALAEKYRAEVMAKVDFFILVGLLKSFNQRFRRLFAEIGIPIPDERFVLTGCEHNAACILDREGLNLLAWLEGHMAAADGEIGCNRQGHAI
jgi:esterase/lipase superfamily enzyme